MSAGAALCGEFLLERPLVAARVRAELAKVRRCGEGGVGGMGGEGGVGVGIADLERMLR